ncbi:MAG: hypothetical protein KBT11_05480, partial [Treponema sp.]|nr:hypothetical protein [Candidatus Treponema equifaecale]
SIALENDSETIEFSSEKMLQKLHLVSATDKKLLLSFVWAPKGKNLSSVSKLGLFEYDLESKKGEFLYQKDAVCVNGIVSGVTDGFIVMNEDSLNATSNCLLYFVSSEYEKNPLYKTEISLENFERVEAVFAKHEIETENIEAGFSENKKNNFTAEKFSSLPYYLKGLRLPLGIVPVYETDFSEKSRALLGVTYASSNPWLDNLLILSAGYDFSTNSYGTFFNLRGNDLQTSYQISGTCIFDSEGFKQTVDSAVFSRKLYNGRLWKLNSGLSSQIFYGREENQRVTVLDTREIEEGIVYETDFRKKGFFSNSTGFLSISNVHKFSQKSNNFAGITIQPFIKFQWDDYNLDFSKVNHKIPQKDEYLNLGLSLLARVPFVFPLSFQADLFPEKNYFADAYAKVYIHSWEIQKGIPAVSIFLNRITLSASYTGLFAYDHEKYWDALRTAEIAEKFSFDDYSDRISLNLNFELCPNTGYLADPACQFVIGGVMVFRPNPKPGEARTAFGITGSLNL